jgi:hypothetical protein
LKIICCKDMLTNTVEGGYASDLLSDVMASAGKGDIWITLQCHPNIAAVGMVKMLSGIILIGGREPEEDTIKKAVEKKIPILSSKLPAFELIGKLYALGISGLH